jgi:hypothetical protein
LKNTWRNTAWIDLLTTWIDSLPIQAWLFYVLLLSAISLVNFFILIPIMVLSGTQLFYSSFLLTLLLIAIHSLSYLAKSSFEQFSSSLDYSKAQIAEWRHRFLFASPWLGWITLILGILASAFEGTFYDVGVSALTLFYMANSIRRLRLVIFLHSKVDNIDLFHLSPLRAFSRFSSSTAIILLMPILSGAPYTNINAETLVFYGVNGVLALAVFILPLVGLRNRINLVRSQKIHEIMEDVELIAKNAREAVHQDDVDKLAKLKSGLDLMLIQREELQRVQTWPWKTSTIQGFLSAFMLPIIIWLITRILERVI